MVLVTAGANKSKTPAKVISVDSKKMKVLVEGTNLKTRHTKPSAQSPQGGIVKKEAPIHYSNLALADKKGKATRIGIETKDIKGKKTKVRIAKTTGDQI